MSKKKKQSVKKKKVAKLLKNPDKNQNKKATANKKVSAQKNTEQNKATSQNKATAQNKAPVKNIASEKKKEAPEKPKKKACSIRRTRLPVVIFFVCFILICAVIATVLYINVPTQDGGETTSSVSENTTQAVQTEEPVTEAFCFTNYDDIQQQIDYVAKRNGAVGVQVAVIENGKITGTFTYGWAQLNKKKMTSDHKIRVASISKILVGIAAMLMYEDGIIELDESISEIWGVKVENPYYPDDPITIRNMLNHTSSIYPYSDDYSMYYSSVKTRFRNCYSELRPGDFSAWCYNNYVFRTLGMTLELAADRKLDAFLDEKVYEPLSIDAAFAAGDIDNTGLIVSLYDEDNNIERSADRLSTFHCSEQVGAEGLYYAGGLTISAYDLAKIVCMLVGDGQYDGKQIMKPESVEIMETCFPDPLPDGTYQGTPLVYMPDIYGRKGIWFHTGSAYGSFNCFSYDPETGDGVVVLTTGAADLAETADIRYICDDINDYIYRTIS